MEGGEKVPDLPAEVRRMNATILRPVHAHLRGEAAGTGFVADRERNNTVQHFA